MRMITIILAELASDKLKCEEKLQRLINSNTSNDVDENVKDIKGTLRELVLIDNMIEKWRQYSTPEEDKKE